MEHENNIHCAYSYFPRSMSPTRTIELLEKYLGIDKAMAFSLVKKLKMNEIVELKFNDLELMNSFVQEMEGQGLTPTYMTENEKFDPQSILVEYQFFLDRAKDFRIDMFPTGHFGIIFNRSTNGVLIIENNSIAQFVAKEMVARGAEVVYK